MQLLTDINVLQIRKNNIDNLLKLFKDDGNINYPWAIVIGNTYETYKIDKQYYNGNLNAIQNVIKEENIVELFNRDKTNLLKLFDECCKTFCEIDNHKPIFVFMFGHGCEISGDMRYFTSDMDINNVNNTSVSITELAMKHKNYYSSGLPIYIIWDLCRVERNGIPYTKFNLKDHTRSIVVIPVAKGKCAEGGEFAYGGWLTLTFCRALKQHLDYFNNFDNSKFLIIVSWCLKYYENIGNNKNIMEIYISEPIIKSIDKKLLM